MAKRSVLFDRPIPGQSLTAAPGSMKYEKPPQYPSEDEAMYYILDRLSDKHIAPAIKHALKNGVYASEITNGILMKGFSEGKFTPDVAALIAKRTMASVVATGMAQGLDIKDIKIKKPSKKDKELGMLLASNDKPPRSFEEDITGPDTMQPIQEMVGPLPDPSMDPLDKDITGPDTMQPIVPEMVGPMRDPRMDPLDKDITRGLQRD